MRTNYMPNPSFETNLDGWEGGDGIDLTREQPVISGEAGEWVAALTPTGDGTPGGPSRMLLRSDDLEVSSGQRIRALGRVVAGVGSMPPRLDLLLLTYGSDGGFLGTVARTTVSTTGYRMNEAELQVTLSADVASVNLCWYLTDPDDGTGWTDGSLYVDAHLLEHGPDQGGYFDGDTTDEEVENGYGWAHRWTDTPHASPSVEEWLPVRPVALVWRPDTASMLVTVTPEAGAPVVAVHRTDTNGTTPVRVMDGQLPTSNQLVVEDYEVALTPGPVTYTAVREQTHDDHMITMIPAGPVSAWLNVPSRPSIATPVDMVTGYVASRPSQTTVHDVIGRPDALLTFGVLGSRRGTLTYWCPTYADALALLDVYDRGQVVLLRQPHHERLDLYHGATEQPTIEPAQLEPGYPVRWRVDVPYAETTRPAGGLAGSLTWTFDQLSQSTTTFDAVPGRFDTFDDLTIGPLA